MSDTTQHDKIVSALGAWIRQRPGLEPGNYDRAGYISESRRITRQKHDAERLLDEAIRTGPHTDEAWRDAFRAFSGRLAWDSDKAIGPKDTACGRLSYCTGQYWPTEYRAAAAAVLASLLWAHMREAMPEPSEIIVRECSKWNGQTWVKGCTVGTYATEAEADAARGEGQQVDCLYGSQRQSAGDYLRAQFRSRFGARFAAKWFN